MLDLLKHLSGKSWGADRTSLLRLHIMLLKPMLEYGSEAYSSAAKSYFEKIEIIQNSALRVATGAFGSSPFSSLHSECGIKPFTYYLDTKHLNFYSRIILNPQNPLRQAALACLSYTAELYSGYL